MLLESLSPLVYAACQLTTERALTTIKSFRARNTVGNGRVEGKDEALTRTALPMKLILQMSKLRHEG